MTKEEIRILSIAKMELEENSCVLDVGAGTGSVTIQAAKICSKGSVIGIEKDQDAINTIKANIEKFQVKNLTLMEGSAGEKLKEINTEFDSVFIGGSSGELEFIIEESYKKLKTGGTMVLNFITINNLYKAMEKLKSMGMKAQCSEIAVSKTKENTYMLLALNPIFIVKAVKL